MTRTTCLRSVTCALLLGLVASACCRADDGAPCGKDGCPKPSYEPAHYRFPILWNIRQSGLGLCPKPTPEVYHSDCITTAPPTYKIIYYPCPPVEPARLFVDRNVLP